MSGIEIVGLMLGITVLAVAPLPSKAASLLKATAKPPDKRVLRVLERAENRLYIYNDLFLNEFKRLLRPLDLTEEDIEKLFGESGAQDERWESPEFVGALEEYLGSSIKSFSKTVKEIHVDFQDVRVQLEGFAAEADNQKPADKTPMRKRSRVLTHREKLRERLKSLENGLRLFRKQVKKFLDLRQPDDETATSSGPTFAVTRANKQSGWEEAEKYLADCQRMSARLSDYILRSKCSCHFLNIRLDSDCTADEHKKIVFRFLVDFRDQGGTTQGSMDIDSRPGSPLQELEVVVRKIAHAHAKSNKSPVPHRPRTRSLTTLSSPSQSITDMMPRPLPIAESVKRKRVAFAKVVQISEAVSNKFRRIAAKPPPAPEPPSPSTTTLARPRPDNLDEEDDVEDIPRDVPVIENLCMTLTAARGPTTGSDVPSPSPSDRSVNNCLGTVADPDNVGDGELKYMFYNSGHRQYPRDSFKNSTLSDILSRKGEFLTRDRLKLALQLASSLLVLHLRSWISTNWRSSDVLMLENNSASAVAGDSPPEWLPYTVNDVKAIRSADQRSRPTQNFQRSYIYSLGVILLEIGMCRPMKASFDNDDEERMLVRDLMYQSVVERDLGLSYKAIVEKCLSWHKKEELGDHRNDLTSEKVQKVFYEEVVEELRLLFEGQCKF